MLHRDSCGLPQIKVKKILIQFCYHNGHVSTADGISTQHLLTFSTVDCVIYGHKFRYEVQWVHKACIILQCLIQWTSDIEFISRKNLIKDTVDSFSYRIRCAANNGFSVIRREFKYLTLWNI